MTATKQISIIGATGNLGVPVVKNLVRLGYNVHAIVRNREKAKALFDKMPDVKISKANLRDVPALKTALKGTAYLYLNLSTQATDLKTPFTTEREGVANIIDATDKDCIKQIISISGLGALDNNQDAGKFTFIPNIIRKQGHKLIKESGIPYTILHCTWFADSFVLYRRNNTYMVIGDPQNPVYFTNCYDFSCLLANAIGNSDAFYKEFPVQGTKGINHPDAAKLFFSEFSENTKVKIAPGWILALAAVFNKEMKFIKHMSDYFRKTKEEFLSEEFSTFQTLEKPKYDVSSYAKKIKDEKFYDYLNITKSENDNKASNMKSTGIKTIFFAVIAALTISCSSNKEMTTPKSLYKTEEGKTIAYKSYDKTMKLWDLEYREEFVDTDYGKSHVIISGENNEQSLVLLPGLFADATMWYPNVKALSQHFKVYTLDMINYGGKSKPVGKPVASMDDYKIWFTQILEHYRIEKASVAGLSYGSWLALALAREIPDNISGLALLDPSETFMPMKSSMAWKGFKYFMFFPNRKKYEKFFDWMGGGYTDPQLDIWFEHMLDVIEYGSVGMFDIPQHKIYEPEELKMIKMPVLIMAGGKPIIYDSPEAFKANALKAIPHAEVVIVPDAGHGLNMEKPEIVNKKMIDFLRNIQN